MNVKILCMVFLLLVSITAVSAQLTSPDVLMGGPNTERAQTVSQTMGLLNMICRLHLKVEMLM